MYGKFNKTVSSATVYRRYTRITRGTISARSLSGRPRTVKTKQLTAKIKRKVCLNKKRKFKEESRLQNNDCVYAEPWEAPNKDFGARSVHKFPFKVMVWAEITFQRVTDIVILPQKTSFDAAFFVKSVLPISKTRLIGPDFTFKRR